MSASFYEADRLPPVPFGTCAFCDLPIWMDVRTFEWAPGALFHVACDVYVGRGLIAFMRGVPWWSEVETVA